MAYMTVFAIVQWGTGGSMVGYSLFYFCIDTLVVSRALNWFITDIRIDILPVRASNPGFRSTSIGKVAWPGICIGVIALVGK